MSFSIVLSAGVSFFSSSGGGSGHRICHWIGDGGGTRQEVATTRRRMSSAIRQGPADWVAADQGLAGGYDWTTAVEALSPVIHEGARLRCDQ
ncbi:hypothetical protein ACP4OV_009364 [Aristida adscensionis]